MNPMVWMWIALGGAAGAAQSSALWHAAHRWKQPSLVAACRLPAVAGVLIFAAFAGGLFPAAGGWAGALAGTSALLCVRSGR